MLRGLVRKLPDDSGDVWGLRVAECLKGNVLAALQEIRPFRLQYGSNSSHSSADGNVRINIFVNMETSTVCCDR